MSNSISNKHLEYLEVLSSLNQVPGVSLAECCQEIRRLREDILSERAASYIHIALNRRAAEALGKPVVGKGSSWHDIPEQIRALQHQLISSRQAASTEAENCEVLEKTIKGREAAMQEALSLVEYMANNWPGCACDSEDKCSIHLVEGILRASLEKP